MRPWNADEWGAFVSWFLFGHLVWILVGTTTFFSLIILFINTVFAQGKLVETSSGTSVDTDMGFARNIGQMGWRLPYQVSWFDGSVRVGHRSQVEGWGHHI
jgi:hypothetical protein